MKLCFRRFIYMGVLSLGFLAMIPNAVAGDLRLNLPKRTKPTPVQKLNQEGVRAVQKHDYDHAKRLFYDAYLIDPNDPFTLNNLGYVAELEGDIDRAQRYYTLAGENTSDATIARASDSAVEGKPVSVIAGNAADERMQINRMNIEAMSLLMKDRAPEADLILQRAYAMDSKNPFTMNNFGFAKEKEGEIEQALRYYQEAANTKSEEPVVVTPKKEWRGQAISSVAAENARNARRQMDRVEDVSTKVARLNLRGVSAVNRNDRRLAREYFSQAFKLDPNNAFTLNNMGYLAELDGDRESAEYFYAKSQSADRSSEKVASATRHQVEGMKLSVVAAVNDQTIDTAQQVAQEERRRVGGPVILRHRDNSIVVDQSLQPKTVMAPRTSNPSEVLIPNPTMAQPTGSVLQPSQTVIEPLPENQQGTTTQQPNSGQGQQSQGEKDGGLLMPLPDEQQPENTQPSSQSPR